MAKERMLREFAKKRDLMREQLAHQTAKLMAEDGITDHGVAKRKAARQLGAADTRHMPSNQEIDEALNSYRALFQRERHPVNLRRLREEALESMFMLQSFRPYLTGSVLKGIAGEQSDINLIIYSDDAKALLLFLLKHGIPFEEGMWKELVAGQQRTVPSYTIIGEYGTKIHIAVLPSNAQYSGNRKPDTHADINTLKMLLSA